MELMKSQRVSYDYTIFGGYNRCFMRSVVAEA
jgi:hypothetical protein